MGKKTYAAGGIIGFLAVVGVYLYTSGAYIPILISMAEPDHGYDASLNVAAPDYSQQKFWAALPATDDLADSLPVGEVAATDAPADVFFVHPTGFLNGKNWNSLLEEESRTEENTKWMLINQASAFNGCCDIYAPRYREASIFRYLTDDEVIITRTMDLAYSDVVNAFNHFLETYSKGRPFIIASHSQGTEHAFRLLREHIDGTPLADRMVAAYLIGMTITNTEADALRTVKPCTREEDSGCLLHWATYGENGAPQDRHKVGMLCHNPINWERGGKADASSHIGAVPISGTFARDFFSDDGPAGAVFDPLKDPIPALTSAEYINGILIVRDMDGTLYEEADLGGKNYHGLDYPLFHMDIRKNAVKRVSAYLAKQGR